ncbi:MAG: hypothetical protein GY750_00335 [Lentisphaerae bacterium]|nr:hypothetical protein [Lentisphaerota bacterium]MCP4099867.1 hypothetical protein [Lentisphaerota bacterium]
MSGWLNRFKENDGPCLQRLLRKLRSSRAAVMVEFAFIFPVVVAVTVFSIELVQYWDATVMANHTAYTLARVAKVHVSGDKVSYPKLVQLGAWGEDGNYIIDIESDRVITSLYMMTATTGYYKGTADWVSLPDLMQLIPNFDDWHKNLHPDDKSLFDAFYGLILNASKPVFDEINGWINDSIKNALMSIMGDKNGFYTNRLLTLYRQAHQRTRLNNVLKTEVISLKPQTLAHPSDVKTVKPWEWVGNHNLFSELMIDILRFFFQGILDVPQTTSYGDPALVKVEVNWPMTSSWIFSAFFVSGGTFEKPIASGRAIMLAEPVRSDSDLKGWFATDSGGNLPGDGEGTKPPTDEIGELEKLHQEYDQKFAEKSKLQMEIQNRQSQIQQLQDAISDLQQKKDLAETEEARKEFQKEIDRLNQQIDQLNKEISDLQKQLDTVNKELDDIYERIKDANEHYNG